MAYDVFISYRRKGAYDLAQLLYYRLDKDGYHTFLDVEEMNSGCFNTQLYDRIDECSDVIVLLSEGALDPHPGEDFMRMEIAHAIKQGKKIIPVFMRNFEFPESLPEDIEDLPHYQGITTHDGYFDAAYIKLKRLLTQPESAARSAAPEAVCAITGAFTALILALAGRTMPADAPALISGFAAHTLAAIVLFGCLAGAAADMLASFLCNKIHRATAVTLCIMLTLGAVVLSGLIPPAAMQLITAAGCIAFLIKSLLA